MKSVVNPMIPTFSPFSFALDIKAVCKAAKRKKQRNVHKRLSVKFYIFHFSLVIGNERNERITVRGFRFFPGKERYVNYQSNV